MGKKREDYRSSGYRGGFHRKNAPAQGIQRSIAELNGAVFAINPNKGDAVKFEKSSDDIRNYVVHNYDSVIFLAKGTR